MDLKLWIRDTASRLGFDLCGIAPAGLPGQDTERYLWWLEQGFHGEMGYMERQQRRDVRLLLQGVRSVICAAMVYNTPLPKSIECPDPTRGWISRYGWGEDYHHTLRERLEQLLAELRLAAGSPFEAKVYVDTGPLLERSFARAAGLGWVAKNTCLIHPKVGSWFMVGEILTTLELPPDPPVPDRCGTCRRCIDACPTSAIVEPYVLDASRCIAYFTIEARGTIPEEFRPAIGRHVFGCDICQDVCPWNRKAPVTLLPEFQPRAFRQSNPEPELRSQKDDGLALVNGMNPSPDGTTGLVVHRGKVDQKVPECPPTAFNPPLEWLASLSEAEFNALFRRSPVKRARYRGLLRNAAIAMGNSRELQFRPVLQKLAELPEPIIQEHARWALARLEDIPAARSTLG